MVVFTLRYLMISLNGCVIVKNLIHILLAVWMVKYLLLVWSILNGSVYIQVSDNLYAYFECVYSQISDTGNLQDTSGLATENLESLAAAAFERRIANLERENKELQRKLGGLFRRYRFFIGQFIYIPCRYYCIWHEGKVKSCRYHVQLIRYFRYHISQVNFGRYHVRKINFSNYHVGMVS